MKKRHNFRELKVWKEGIAIAKSIYSLSVQLPETEKYGLRSQMTRSAVSVPSNIAEGTGRTTEKELVQFLRFSTASSYELETQLILVEEVFEIPTDEIKVNLNGFQNMIGAFIRSINPEG